jgi:hypothetical protein
MAETKIVWVENTTNNAVQLAVSVKTGDTVRIVEYTFTAHREDPMTGLLVSDGYTDIPVADFDLLFSGSKLFRNYIETGKLVKYSEKPAGLLASRGDIAGLPQQLEVVKAENELLMKENADLKKQLEAVKKK